MEDLCDMMDDYPVVDAEECEGEYDNRMGESYFEEEDTFFDRTMDAQSLGLALGLAEMMAEENAQTEDPADVFDDYQDSRRKLSLQDRHQKGKARVPAFEQYVYKRCGIL